MSDAASPTGAVERIARLASGLADPEGTTVEEVLAGAVTLVSQIVPGVRWASLTHRTGQLQTVAASHSRANALDEVQYRTGSGPCLAALEQNAPVTCDVATDHRWPEFTKVVIDNNLATGSVSYPLADVGHKATSLNLYTDLDGASEQIDKQVAEVAVPLLAIVLTAANQRHSIRHLEIGLTTSRSIGAAVGVLMSRRNWTYDQAFEALRTASQHGHRRLRDIAADVVLTGELPG